MVSKELKIANYQNLLEIKVIESEEEMVNISLEPYDCICVYEKLDMIDYVGEFIWVRKTLADKLKNISKKLKTKFPEYKLKIVYGYRHPEIQEKYFNERKFILFNNSLKLSEEEMNKITHETVALPEVAGHTTGGAVDITITTPNGDLDMGTKIADFSDLNKIKTFNSKLNDFQKINRKLLEDLMISEEFAPFYGEWWHFSYGDREWAWFYNKPNAIYDQINFILK